MSDLNLWRDPTNRVSDAVYTAMQKEPPPMDLTVAYFKFLDSDHEGTNTPFDYHPYLPVDNGDGTYTPGKWLPPVEGDLVLCANGYHYTRLPDLLQWADARLYLVEPSTDYLDGDTKSCARSLRLLAPVPTWNDQTARLFACDCVEHIIPVIERIDAPSAQVCRDVIGVARRFAHGDATQEELAAARDAARAAAWDAAWAAARAAAWDAAWAAARAAERQWQLNRLQEYLRGDVQPLDYSAPNTASAETGGGDA